MGKWLPQEVKRKLKEQKKVEPFLLAQKRAESYAHENVERDLDKIQSKLLAGDGMTWVWTKETAKEMLGQAIALAYATGYLDATNKKQDSKLIL